MREFLRILKPQVTNSRTMVTTSKVYLINCHILFEYFELVFLQLQLLKTLCKLIII